MGTLVGATGVVPVTTVGPVDGSPVAVRVKSVFNAAPPLTVFVRASRAAINGVNVFMIVQVMVRPASADVIVNRLPTKVPPPVQVKPLVVYPTGPVSVRV